jgi:4-hydroxybenzoate polyprenyltransferase
MIGSARLSDYASLIKLSHSVFALPFAVIALLVATGGAPSIELCVAVVLAMVAARSAAMAYNRFADRDVDARNPRTAGREIPRGVIRPATALGLAIGSGAAFCAIALWISPVCFWLSLPVLGVLLGYSHAKRFTAWSHVWLGAALGLAPMAAWVAARGEIGGDLLVPAVLGVAVMVWVAGFDVLYACQDEEFDRSQGLRSIPARVGRGGALWIARLLHLAAVAAFAAFGIVAGLGVAWFVGVAVAGALLWREHSLVSVDSLDRIDAAFFTMNGLVSIAFLGFTMLDLYVV